MKSPRFLPIAILAGAVLAACSTTPTSDSPLAQARADYSDAQANSQVTWLAPSELRQAGSVAASSRAMSTAIRFTRP